MSPKVFVTSLGLTAMITACATTTSRRADEAGDEASLSFRASTFVFIEYCDLATVAVGTRAARYRDNDDFMPVEISVANENVRRLVVTRESFTLIDEDGNRYAVADARDLRRGYRFLDMDRTTLSELPDVTSSTFDAFRPFPSKFTPTFDAIPPDRLTLVAVRDTVILTRLSYLVDYIYFPKPVGGITGHRFDLVFKSLSIPDSVRVTFAVN